MLPKSKHPHLNRAQRRHLPSQAASLGRGAAPSALLQTLLIREGYWPENDLVEGAKLFEQARTIRNEKIGIAVPKPSLWSRGKSLLRRALGRGG